MTALHDMHCHLDFIVNGAEVARDARQAGTAIFANTVTPESWRQAHGLFGDMDNVTVGFGLHPWWVITPEDADNALRLLRQHDPRFIGEVGLDLGRRHAGTADLQVDAFDRIMRWAAERGGKVISIHSVHAAERALDILESTGAADACTCLFHWFTGPSDQLKRAVQLGCFFSFGPRALKTGKGREYVKAVPADRLLLETDYPPEPDKPGSYEELRGQLTSAAESVAGIKGEEALETIASTSLFLLREA